MYGCKANSLFAMRALIDNSPIIFNLIVLTSGIMIFAQAIRICEAPLSRVTNEMNHYDFSNCIWIVVLTMTTGKTIPNPKLDMEIFTPELISVD